MDSMVNWYEIVVQVVGRFDRLVIGLLKSIQLQEYFFIATGGKSFPSSFAKQSNWTESNDWVEKLLQGTFDSTNSRVSAQMVKRSVKKSNLKIYVWQQ